MTLSWYIDASRVALVAPSRVYHDQGGPINYTIHQLPSGWVLDIEGSGVCRGTLIDCLNTCDSMEAEAAKVDAYVAAQCERGEPL